MYRGEIRDTRWWDFDKMVFDYDHPAPDGGGRGRFRGLKYRFSVRRIKYIPLLSILLVGPSIQNDERVPRQQTAKIHEPSNVRIDPIEYLEYGRPTDA